jgi:hypothetical protein
MCVILLNYNQGPTTLSVILILSQINPIKSLVHSPALWSFQTICQSPMPCLTFNTLLLFTAEGFVSPSNRLQNHLIRSDNGPS